MRGVAAPAGAPEAGTAPGASELGPAIAVRGLVRRHPGGRGIGPVDLTVGRGEVVSLVGSNGAGKTTLLRVVATIDAPDDGVVTWFGDPSPMRARRRIGLALDTAADEETWSARQTVHFWCRFWVGDRLLARRLADAALRRFGLDAVADEPVAAYSFGMRRRLLLACAVAHDPDLLLLDEPTSGLDPDGVRCLVDIVERRRARGATTVIASNALDLVTRISDRVALVVGGRVLRIGSPLHVLATVAAQRVVEVEGVGLDPVGLRRAPGVRAVEPTARGAVLRLEPGASLAGLVASIEAMGADVRSLRVHRPDLGDALVDLGGSAVAEEHR